MSDAAHLRATWRLLKAPDGLVEARALRRQGPPAIGRFDDEAAFLRAVAQADADPLTTGVYATLNPVRPDAPWRGPRNQWRLGGRAAADGDILRRRWILIDVDPARPARTNATAAERAAAEAVAAALEAGLRGVGWGDPVAASSGNGAHRLYPCRLANDAEAADLVRRALAGIARRYDAPEAAVDPAVFNAGRITKVYGTTPRKGDPSPERPWHPAALARVPAGLRPVPPEAIALVAAWAGRPREAWIGPTAPLGPMTRDVAFLMTWLQGLGVPILEDPRPWGAGWILAVPCPWAERHTVASPPSSTAVIWTPAGVGFRCLHAHCAQRRWKDFRAAIEAPRRARGPQAAPARREGSP
ncbi:MAG: DNA primase [Firmicutes bacterium]|nr:DNA primase [Bacillota bacterium]